MFDIRWVALATLFVAAPHHALHVHLVRSEPAANDTLHTAPPMIRLWFSEAPELAITSVHLTNASGRMIALGRPTRDAASDAPVVTHVDGAVGPGTYVIIWKTTAPDGHPASGRIPFVVRP